MNDKELAQKLFDWFCAFAEESGDWISENAEPTFISMEPHGVNLEDLAKEILQWVKS